MRQNVISFSGLLYAAAQPRAIKPPTGNGARKNTTITCPQPQPSHPARLTPTTPLHEPPRPTSLCRPLTTGQKATLDWLLRETFEPGKTAGSSFLSGSEPAAGTAATLLVEVGPRLSFESATSSNAKSICRASGIDGVTRLEVRCGGMGRGAGGGQLTVP